MNQKELLIVSITIFVTIMTWIVADIYHISTTQKFMAVESPVSTLGTSKIDVTILDILQKRHE
ncbi:hypothetical protein A3D80_03235 [Candidatus Roizmanbacteria bacterium RIFCSPHIGHO2_02_FULL_40_13b]|uniref:Uncharacterized protein n=1 Tax=Candidatus Roizmanbacteria bacterium RIFCSPHIGHO2_01_FULL_39_24 TaxID=1802032 RepID=A0A1F7GLP0_9BACT|nr:MAG: hypothetical protein A2799_00980 [Candidatus Roizmanbacteria bacterium RIFCSPHIGHO2_01_FULL_39_24]OGK26981.1 MAG: hypothetical protein A3D80_03235 [Candidatus Roizmanbacteria bacterium RIFCSPHIGHO2_02_FULL_40_13b]OGK48864.1 MAG: hypothetical protein A3A56_01490 [Candidatus Roizmanbacteria bacterium RIFCSPLOWO2_01_FULL_40_32]OGK57172.1 MAG: hypothetical protein A3H83_00755 [Candidatus Roizmanbacteria bacterium RIFCSPLOWO2_02_FULL_39_8]